jgi:hypothetical protein
VDGQVVAVAEVDVAAAVVAEYSMTFLVSSSAAA